MKKIIVLLMIFIMAVSITAFATENISVYIGNKKLEFDVQPQLINDRTMVPMRKIFESLGAEVTWVGEAETIVATRDSQIIVMEIGKLSFTVTDVKTEVTKEVILDVPPQLVESRTLVPVRAISETFGYTVNWDDATTTVTILRPAA
ncbi:MAG: copper amine oxidase N-terminal domain-containing protein [Clostridia bacterium]|nr:copper amine oxidase N-terminal domain-containing protein [Clostridia bacterium]